MQLFYSLVKRGVREGVSDMHVTGGHPVVFRKNGKVVFVDKVVISPENIDNWVLKVLTPRHLRILRERFSVDLAMSIANIRLRINIFTTTRGLSIAARFLPSQIPSLGALNLHPSLARFCSKDSGLVLFCGPTGSGKSTTIASLLNQINKTRSAHAITLEDPIEYKFPSGQAFFQQRELGEHFLSFEQGLLDVLREDPDIIVVGELREAETIRLTLSAAESGHLVFASLHASNAEEAIYRICNSFPLEAQEFVRYQLASSVEGIVTQQLIYDEKRGFRVPLLSIMFPSLALRKTIRDNKIEQIENLMELCPDKDVYTFKRYRQEFLGHKTNFIAPWNTLKPTLDARPEQTYTSSVLTKTGHAPLETGRPAEQSPCLVLDKEGHNVEDIITQITSRGAHA